VNSRRYWLVGVVILLAVTAALVIRNQIKVERNREARAARTAERHRAAPVPPDVQQRRQALFDLFRPVALSNCELQRFGEQHDGGYLMCANLLGEVKAGYSYGIGGYDQWGCDVSTRLDVTVHQYDCFNTTRPVCRGGRTMFHEECVADSAGTSEGRVFDTIASQLGKNGDAARRIVLKIDVEGAEWDSLMAVPDALLQQIDQLVVEFHWIEDEKFRWIGEEQYVRLAERLRQFFEVAHLHVNNSSCVPDLAPFTGWAYEVLFVNKRLAVVDRSRQAGGVHPLDARNNPSFDDCQPAYR
jgi:hypothetical protein